MIEWGVALNVVEPVETTVSSASLLESGGIHALWITDFPAVRSAAPLAAAVAENTSRCRIGIGLLSSELFGVDSIVRKITTLIDNFGDRFDVLIGPGDKRAFEGIGIAPAPSPTVASRTVREAVGVRTVLKESGHRSRVFLGAQGPWMIAQSVKLDGVLLNYSDSDMIAWAVHILGNRNKDFTLGIFPPTLLARNMSFESCDAIRRASAMVALGLTSSVQEEFGVSAGILAGRAARGDSDKIGRDVLDAMGNDVLRRFSMFGDVPFLCGRLKEVASIGVGLVVFGPPLCTVSESLELLLEAKRECKP